MAEHHEHGGGSHHRGSHGGGSHHGGSHGGHGRHERNERRGGGGWGFPLVIGGGILAFILLAEGLSRASESLGPSVGPKTPPVGPPWPATPFQATINSNAPVGSPSLIVRAGPSQNTTRVGDNPNGVKVTVLATGLKASDGSAGEWWQVQTPAGNGFSRAVDPAGYQNFIVSTPTTAGIGHAYVPYGVYG